MPILGVGVDIIEIARITAIIARVGDRLAKRVLSHTEFSQYQIHFRPDLFLAKSFAVKEATVKAFGLGMRDGLAFHQIEIYHDALGKPYVRLLQHAKVIEQNFLIKNIHVTLSDERKYAVAMVVMET
ncbi:holo-ACP synthase [Candidatus Erwinia haradaeae]|uniref:Holo-[acyl-carrier-protein] synthase n=1 Tax=Candidatus Erwinia haradaeae TaxID=1922217 RepID=A0A451DAD8_9GAMM|nr:holo-ACP synthase [Candidatus Erwinia haradaeae]VFP83208.1 Holo-[acyl-carrier-protein] synthase [Candidatus Erwinia haradaeae]